jgi:hypothetical protein
VSRNGVLVKTASAPLYSASTACVTASPRFTDVASILRLPLSISISVREWGACSEDHSARHFRPQPDYEAKGYEAKGYEAKGYEAKDYEAKGYEAKGYEAKGSTGEQYVNVGRPQFGHCSAAQYQQQSPH